jgi:flagellar biosynthesis chaperone FliJ
MDEKKQRLVEELQAEVVLRLKRVEDLQTEITRAREDANSYARALAALTGEPRRVTVTKPPRKGTTGLGVSMAKLDLVVTTIRNITAEQDEFRQIDVRQRTNLRSGETALAFRSLRADGVIRLARQAGNNKYFALTREALKLRDADVE